MPKMPKTSKMAKGKILVRDSRTGRSLYPLWTQDSFTDIVHIAGYTKYPFQLKTMTNGPTYLPVIHSLADVERCKHSIIKALQIHKKLKAIQLEKKK